MDAFQEELIRFARAVGEQSAYAREPYGRSLTEAKRHIAAQLRGVRDLVPKQDAALAYLMREAEHGWERVAGWCGCLVDHLKPLFERGASPHEIERMASTWQGRSPDWAIGLLLADLADEYSQPPMRRQPPRRRR